MSLFEFVAVMISVILALSVAQLYLGVAGLIQRPGKVRIFAPHAIWNINLFLITILHWWSLWDFRELAWTFPMFFLTLIGPSLLFFASTIINPQQASAEGPELDEHFWEVRSPFLVVVLITLVAVTIDGPLFGTEPAINSLRIGQALLGAAVLWGLSSSERRSHTIIAGGALLVIVLIALVRLFPGDIL